MITVDDAKIIRKPGKDNRIERGEWTVVQDAFVAADAPYAHAQNDATAKPSNPKDIIGSDKVPLHLWPETASVMGSLALLDGALKYGRSNWRGVGVKATIYYDALRRHLMKWFEGQDTDTDSGLPHLAHMLACLAIIIDAQAAGKFTDDRMFPGGGVALLDEATPHVKRLKEKYKDRNPHHYTIQDVRVNAVDSEAIHNPTIDAIVRGADE